MRSPEGGKGEAGAIAYFRDVAYQDRLAGHLRQKHVKIGSKPDRSALGSVSRIMLCIDDPPQLLHLRICQPAGKTPHHLLFQVKADIENIPRVLEGGRGDNRNAVAPQVDEAFRRQLTERMSGNSATDAEALAERVLRQSVTRCSARSIMARRKAVQIAATRSPSLLAELFLPVITNPLLLTTR